MVGIIRNLATKNLVNVYTPPGEGNILKYGEYYTSRAFPRKDETENNGFFIFHFKKSIVHIDSYKMKAVKGSTFPKKWKLYVSNDNTTWEQISSITKPLCKDENSFPVPDDCKDQCSKEDEEIYSTNHTGFHYFVKFVMIENSYYCGNKEWDDCIRLNGFELFGSFTRDHLIQHSCNKMKNMMSIIFLLSITNTMSQ